MSARRRSSLLTGCILAISLLFSQWPSSAAWSGELEFQVKAAFLYNFARFVTWPDEAFVDKKAPFCIGILGTDPFGDDLEKIVSGKWIDGRAVKVQHLDSVDKSVGCHILFISSSEAKQLESILTAVEALPILTVGDMDHFAKEGGILNFVLIDSKVRFEVNVSAVEQSPLSFNSKLLSLAIPVTPTTPPTP